MTVSHLIIYIGIERTPEKQRLTFRQGIKVVHPDGYRL